MKKILCIIILLGFVLIRLDAQNKMLMTEKDGFKWYQTNDGIAYGAESVDGKTLIPLSRGYSLVSYTPVPNHKGYFGTYGKDPDNNSKTYKQGACDIYGKEIIATKYDIILYNNGFQYVDKNWSHIPLNITLDADGHASSYHLASTKPAPQISGNSAKTSTSSASAKTPNTSSNTKAATSSAKTTTKQQQPLQTIKQIAEIEKIWIEDNVIKDGEYGMNINAKIRVEGYKGKTVRMIAYFYDSDKQYLKGAIPGYKTSADEPCVGKDASVTYDNSHWDNFTLFMPYKALPTVKQGETYYIKIQIYDKEKKDFLIQKSTIYASFTGKAYKDTKVEQTAKTNNPQNPITFNKIWCERDVYQNGVKGIKIHVAFNINGMRGKKCKAIAYFDSPQGTGLPDINGNYCTSDGNVCTSTEFTPGYDNTRYDDLVIFLPNDEFHLLNGEHIYYSRVFIQGPDKKFIPDHSDFVEVLHATLSRSTSANTTSPVAQQQIKPANSSVTGKYGKREGTFYFKVNEESSRIICLKFQHNDGHYYAYNSFLDRDFDYTTDYRYVLYYEDNQFYYFHKVLIRKKPITEKRYGIQITTGFYEVVEKTFPDSPKLIIAKDWSSVTIEKGALFNQQDITYTIEISRDEYVEIEHQNQVSMKMLELFGPGGGAAPSSNSSSTTTPDNSSSTLSNKHGETLCKGCYGSGKCSMCGGNGYYENRYSGNIDECSACHHTGRCGVCYGKGTIHF